MLATSKVGVAVGMVGNGVMDGVGVCDGVGVALGVTVVIVAVCVEIGVVTGVQLASQIIIEMRRYFFFAIKPFLRNTKYAIPMPYYNGNILLAV